MTTKALADFTSALRYEQLSAHSIMMAKKCLLDWLGIAIRGSREQPARLLRQALLAADCGKAANVYGSLPPAKASAANAAFVNSAASHSLDFDDLHNPSIIHPACVVVAPALAVCEAEHKSGRQLITAICAGYEASGRVGEAVIPESYFFWHTTGTAGTIAAGAAAASALGLDAHQTLMCYGSAGTQAAGLWEFLQEGAMSKPLHTGKASYSGVLSAYLSKAGFTAASKILEGEKGFCRAMVREPHLQKLTEGLGTGRLKIDDNSFKPYACCKHAHAALYAIQVLRAEHKLQPAQVKSIRLYVNDITNYLINNSAPQTPYGCKFSIQYCAAAMLKFGEVGIAQFTENVIHDAELAALMQKTQVIRDAAIEQIHADNPAKLASRVELTLEDGTELTMQVDFPKGDPDNPLSWEDICAKFMSLAEPVYGREKALRLQKLVERLEACDDVAASIDNCLKE